MEKKGKRVLLFTQDFAVNAYIISEEAAELEAGTRKEPSWEEWYNWGGKLLLQ